MAKFKNYSYEQQLLLPVCLERQILPGTFEYTLNMLINEKLAPSIFHDKYKNNATGALAYDPLVAEYCCSPCIPGYTSQNYTFCLLTSYQFITKNRGSVYRLVTSCKVQRKSSGYVMPG